MWGGSSPGAGFGPAPVVSETVRWVLGDRGSLAARAGRVVFSIPQPGRLFCEACTLNERDPGCGEGSRAVTRDGSSTEDHAKQEDETRFVIYLTCVCGR